MRMFFYISILLYFKFFQPFRLLKMVFLRSLKFVKFFNYSGNYYENYKEKNRKIYNCLQLHEKYWSSLKPLNRIQNLRYPKDFTRSFIIEVIVSGSLHYYFGVQFLWYELDSRTILPNSAFLASWFLDDFLRRLPGCFSGTRLSSCQKSLFAML